MPTLQVTHHDHCPPIHLGNTAWTLRSSTLGSRHKPRRGTEGESAAETEAETMPTETLPTETETIPTEDGRRKRKRKRKRKTEDGRRKTEDGSGSGTLPTHPCTAAQSQKTTLKHPHTTLAVSVSRDSRVILCCPLLCVPFSVSSSPWPLLPCTCVDYFYRAPIHGPSAVLSCHLGVVGVSAHRVDLQGTRGGRCPSCQSVRMCSKASLRLCRC